MSSAALCSPRRALALALALPGTQRELKVDGVCLSVTDNGGAGIAIVCVHAAGHGSGDFAQLSALVAGRRRLITLDWPGHGRSGDDHEPADASRYARLLVGALDALGLHRVILLGNSVGGAACVEVAATVPQRVAALVLVNSGGFASPNVVTRTLCAVMAWAYRHPHARWFSWFFALQYRVLLRGPHAAAQRRRIVAAGRDHAAVLAELWASFGRPSRDVRGDIAALACPVWLAWARSDPFNHWRVVADALRPLGRPTLYRGGHAPFLEQPAAFWGDLDRFVSDVLPADAALAVAARP